MSDCIIDVNGVASIPTLTWMQESIEDLFPLELQLHMKSLLHCDHTIIRPKDEDQEKHVLLVSSGDDARYLGVMHCNNVWACPHCTAMMMSRRATRIAAAIDQLKSEGKKAMMFTFTVRHNREMPSTMAFNILRAAWDIAINGRKSSSVNGSIKGYMLDHGDGEFVSNYEFTWGENGWHPHIHALFWVREDEIPYFTKEVEDELRRRWQRCLVRAATFLYWHGEPLNSLSKLHVAMMIRDNNFPEMSLLGRYAKKVYDYFVTDDNSPHRGFKISRDKNGEPTIAKSADYIFGEKRKLIGEVADAGSKRAHDGHLNICQILIEAKKAYDSIPKRVDVETGEVVPLSREERMQTSEYKKWYFYMCRYVEYYLMTKGIKRTKFARRVNDAIREYIETHEVEEFIKKNSLRTPKYKLVAVFSESMWNSILRLGLKDIILRTVTNTDTPRKDLVELLEIFNIKLRASPPDSDEYADELEDFAEEQAEEHRWRCLFGLKNLSR